MDAMRIREQKLRTWADQLVYARQREWTKWFSIDRLKLRDMIADKLVDVAEHGYPEPGPGQRHYEDMIERGIDDLVGHEFTSFNGNAVRSLCRQCRRLRNEVERLREPNDDDS